MCAIIKCTKCCGCFPARFGVILWAYFELVTQSLLIAVYTYLIICHNEVLSKRRDHQSYPTIDDYEAIYGIVRFSSYIFVCLLNFLFTVLLLVAVHKKKGKLLNVYLICGIVGVFLKTCALIVSTLDDVTRFIAIRHSVSEKIRYFRFAFLSLCIGLQIYILVLVNEMLEKLSPRSNNRKNMSDRNDFDDISLSLKDIPLDAMASNSVQEAEDHIVTYYHSNPVLDT